MSQIYPESDQDQEDTESAGGRLVLGWREWLALPQLGVPAIKAKIDTGARTSTLHAFDLETVQESGKLQVRFNIRPLRRRPSLVIQCSADVLDRRIVSDSGGHKEQRYVIHTPVRIADREWPIEITLTNRDDMLFRMLLGRTAMQHGMVIDPDQSFLTGRKLAYTYRRKRKTTGAKK
jgi:hypothetical protein